MKTNNFSNGTELVCFQDRNCFMCKHYNYKDVDKSCKVEIKLSLGDELTDDEFKEYFNSVKVVSNSACLKLGGL